jgi:glycosyltransferase involved in cell wall biosynthesis
METLDICVATYSLTKGNGIDVTVAEFARELSKYHNVKLAVITANMEVEGVEITRYKANRPWTMTAAARELDSKNFDFISTHYMPFDVVASLTKTPHLLHDHGIAPLRSLMHNRGEMALWAEVYACRMIAARKTAMALPISDYIGKGFRKKYLYGGKMEILPSGIEFPDTKNIVPFNGFGKYILYVGRHTPYKGVHKLIELFGEARKELGEDVHLVTIGKADLDYDKQLKTLAEKAGNVHMMGFVPDIWPFYAGATAYATCSVWEGEDRPVIEAQYMGKPAIAYNNCSHPEVIFYGDLAKNDSEIGRASCRERV